MKKLLTLLLLTIAFAASAQNNDIIRCNADYYSVKEQNANTGRWSEWSDWKPCDILITLNYGNDTVSFTGTKSLNFNVIKYGSTVEDSKGKIFTNSCIDEDGDRCDVRIRIYKDDTIRIYLDYADFSMCFSCK